VVAVSSLYGVSTPLPAALAILPRWSATVIRLHCSVQAASAVVGVVVFCLVAPQPRYACRRLLCATPAARPPPSRRTSSGSINHDRAVVVRLFHVETTDGKPAGTPVTPTETTTNAADAECLLSRSAVDAAVEADADSGAAGVPQRQLSQQGVERRLAYEQSNAAPRLQSQRSRLLATSDTFAVADDVVFAHTSV